MSNKLIIDSGSTKTQWVIIRDSIVINKIETQGFNPYYFNSDVLKLILVNELIPSLDKIPFTDIFYYGTGCSTNQTKKIVYNALKEVFQASNINIEHDLFGAAISLLKDKAGIACILGTGTNSCVYNGKQITHNIPSLGYLLADEGSGTDLGKLIVSAYLKHELPEDLKQEFKNRHPQDEGLLLKEIYDHDQPNTLLSTFSYFIYDHIEHPFISGLVKSSFDNFFTTYILKYPRYNELVISFTGSIAYQYRDILRESAASFGLEIDLILKNPMDGLIEYHQRK